MGGSQRHQIGIGDLSVSNQQALALKRFSKY